MTTISEFQVKKDDLNQVRLTTRETDAIGEGEILVKVDRFAFTANNVTYGVVGERIGYWKFFPVAENGWGIIPVWGFADVIESNCAEIPVGERLYGYWPMASHLVMRPAKVSDARLFDGADHRAELPPVYNSYARVNAEPAYDAAMDDERMALFPLYATSFCLYDFLKDNDWFSAEQVIIPSASSKTAIGTAYAIKSDDAPPRLVGFTSPRNKAAVEALGLYDTVLTYDDDAVDTATPAVIVDMSGNGEVLGEFEKRAFAFWHEAAIKSRSWLAIQKELGADAVERVAQTRHAGARYRKPQRSAANAGRMPAIAALDCRYSVKAYNCLPADL
ncbi:Uncharacterized protein DUF2855 [Durusdinium trenchii]|uniref:Uncharacterized protein DUF2855 n=1 Tax=Durusdinium trenchii TaxID=1381693 RepID=A0ABP0LRX7_9DINO